MAGDFPLGNSAYRLNVLSALAGALAVAALFVLVRRRAGDRRFNGRGSEWAVSAPLWRISLLEEEYTLHALFAAVLLLLAEGGRESVFSRVRLSGVVIGVGIVNHHSLLFWIQPLGRVVVARGSSALAGRSLVGTFAQKAASGHLCGRTGDVRVRLWIRLGALTPPALAVALRERLQHGDLVRGKFARALTPRRARLLAYAAPCRIADSVGWAAAARLAQGPYSPGRPIVPARWRGLRARRSRGRCSSS